MEILPKVVKLFPWHSQGYVEMLARPLSINKTNWRWNHSHSASFSRSQYAGHMHLSILYFHLQYASFRTTMCTKNLHTIGQTLLSVMLLKPSSNEELQSNNMWHVWSWISSKFLSRRFTLKGFKFEGQNTFIDLCMSSVNISFMLLLHAFHGNFYKPTYHPIDIGYWTPILPPIMQWTLNDPTIIKPWTVIW